MRFAQIAAFPITLALFGCPAPAPGPVVRDASDVEREHLEAFLVQGASAERLHATATAEGRIVFGWVSDPLAAELRAGVWHFVGHDSSVAGAFLPLTSTSERLAPAPEVVRGRAPTDTTALDAALAWLDAHQVSDAQP